MNFKALPIFPSRLAVSQFFCYQGVFSDKDIVELIETFKAPAIGPLVILCTAVATHECSLPVFLSRAVSIVEEDSVDLPGRPIFLKISIFRTGLLLSPATEDTKRRR